MMQEGELLWEKEAFNKKSDLMRGSLSLHLKKRMLKAFVWSVALYGSETWTLYYPMHSVLLFHLFL